jgi:hypothetical protein
MRPTASVAEIQRLATSKLQRLAWPFPSCSKVLLPAGSKRRCVV